MIPVLTGILFFVEQGLLIYQGWGAGKFFSGSGLFFQAATVPDFLPERLRYFFSRVAPAQSGQLNGLLKLTILSKEE